MERCSIRRPLEVSQRQKVNNPLRKYFKKLLCVFATDTFTRHASMGGNEVRDSATPARKCPRLCVTLSLTSNGNFTNFLTQLSRSLLLPSHGIKPLF
ncbi:MAG: hypothetical protein CLLPBCKN_005925 [Chroococcidiopsis cubana SAG 39.79]|nr:hypothetical protein [Chroococcidiopsis cubana SAG 39.79]